MTKRIFKFYDKNNKEDGVLYDNVTEEEFDTLQYYYCELCKKVTLNAVRDSETS